MEKVIQSFKNLFKGEHIGRKHFMLILMFILPALMSGISGFLDKDAPDSILICLLVVILILGILSIIPMFWLLGYAVNFVENRLMGKLGIPQITFTTLLDGFKVFPLTLVWGIYFAIIFLTPFCLSIIPIIGATTNNGTPDAIGILLFIAGLLLSLLLCIAIVVLVAPFYNYIFIEYVKYGNRGELYNPLYLGRFMKLAFKDTLIVFGKFWLVAIVLSFPIGILNLFVMMIAMMVFMGSIMTTPGALESNSNAFMYNNPFGMFIVIILSSFVAIIQMYVNTLIGNAAVENYIGVYKEKIAPLDETPEISNNDFNTL